MTAADAVVVDASTVIRAVSAAGDKPFSCMGVGSLAPAAIDVAVTSGLSVYDALYAVLAGALEVPLVTADQRLAAAVAGSVLIS